MEDFITYIKIYCNANVIKTVSNRDKNTHINSWKGIENPETDPCIYGHDLCDKDGTAEQQI